MSPRSLFLIITLLFIFFTINGFALFHRRFSSKIHNCIDGISRAVKFCKSNSQNLTIDSLIALAILRDSLSDICSAYQLTPSLMEDICYLSKSVSNYFKSMSGHKSSHKLAFLLKFRWYSHPFSEIHVYDETKSENIPMQKYESCIFEMANHFEEQCNISDSCVNQFFNELYNGSDLLKQAFYSLVALRASCKSESVSPVNFVYKSRALSRLLVTEFMNCYSLRNVSTEHRQRLLEQIIYGGLGGYLQMAHPVMMDEIMSWQDESGCFKTVKTNELIPPDSIHFEREVQFRGGCLLRLTSVAAAALAMHIQRFSIAEVYKPDFHYILQMENTFGQNDKMLPDFIESKLDSSRSSKIPYANVPDTVL
ncbi:unnamed protein product [Hymenolepis diminuta]|uniref:Uncharacterized protein n=1 Tax=Hymenolepis diminuta TaxID=6216 RepID=A0A564Z1V7_HYMDI|nr:unnamed protein product [Hymenolepis diminuta]